MAIRDLKKLYTANCDNVVVVFATNLTKFVDQLAALEPNARNYRYYDREFKKETLLHFTGESGKKYVLQQVYSADQRNVSGSKVGDQK